jgi:hypothetical protein
MFAPAKYDHDGTFVNVTKSAPTNLHSKDFKTPEIPDVISPYVVTKPTSKEVPKIKGSMSQGTVAQLLSIGPQDRFLSLNPQMSFFRTAYKRHTNFAVETFDETFGGPQLTFGTTNVATLGKHGDLFGNMTLRVVLPNIGVSGGTWVDTIGYVLLSRIRLRIGDVVIQTHERLWYDIEDKLFATEGKVDGLNQMIGRNASLATDEEHEILVPLKFMCCSTFSGRQQFLPVVCLDTNVDVSVEIDVESLDKCVVLPAGSSISPSITGAECSLLVDNVYLDTIERARVASVDATYLIDAIQDVDQVSYLTTAEGIVPITNVSINLRELNMPVKYFAGVAYEESYTDYFTYLDVITSATMLVNSEQQFEPRNFTYFSLQQPYDRFVRSEQNNVFGFSFALHAESWQPNGALNFAPLQNTTFRFTLNGAQSTPLKVKLFASCINWITFKNGRCAFAFDF